MARAFQRTLVIVLICSLSLCSAFSLPGVKPAEFEQNDAVDLKVNRLMSVHTQLPYKYYTLPFCQPEQIVDKSESLGEVLRGDRIENSLYEIKALVNEKCKVLCSPREYNKDQVEQFRDKIQYDYRVYWIVDNLPAAIPRIWQNSEGDTEPVYETGFPLGYKGETGDEYYLNNHVDIKLLYHRNSAAYSGVRIVGFEVKPESIEHTSSFSYDKNKPEEFPASCLDRESPSLSLNMNNKEKLPVIWTYSVTWEESDTAWTERWDPYLQNTDPQIHWFSIINSLMIVLFLTGMVAMIMMRTLRADIGKYNSMDPNEEAEETGWKLVHGDVFRPPSHPLMLSVLIGSGIQVLGMTLITMLFSLLGFLSPANRGGLLTAGVVLFVVMGLLGGYFSTRNYKLFGGVQLKKNTIATALFFPGVIVTVFTVLNIVIAGQKSSGAVPFGTFVALIGLWFGISMPLVFLGSYFANKKPIENPPVRTNQIPRQIPDQLWYMHPIFSILMGGILPFGAVFIELFFILSAIWGQQFYYIFGFLFMVFIILVVTCAEITIVMCYFQLCSEDYHWWWRSYLTAGASALYMFLYSIFYFFTKLEIDKFVSGLLYFGYTFIMSFAFFVMTGTVGYYACLFFVRKIYSQIKVD